MAGCVTAQTDYGPTATKMRAETFTTPAGIAKEMADAFGPDCAYLGYSWTVHADSAFLRMLDFVNQIKLGITAQQVFDAYKVAAEDKSATDWKLLKIYSTENETTGKHPGLEQILVPLNE